MAESSTNTTTELKKQDDVDIPSLIDVVESKSESALSSEPKKEKEQKATKETKETKENDDMPELVACQPDKRIIGPDEKDVTGIPAKLAELCKSKQANRCELVKEIQTIMANMDDDTLKLLPTELVDSIRKRISPYGNVISSTPKKIITMCHTNLREKYMKRYLITAMIGFLNRACDEWCVPKSVPVVSVYDYVKNPKLIDPPDDVKLAVDTKEDYESNAKMMQKRIIVKEFLEDMFQYDPDLHVRSAYKPCPKDPQRKILNTPAAKRAIIYRKLRDAKFRADMDFAPPTSAKSSSSSSSSSSSKSNTDERAMVEMIPPDDAFHNFSHYADANHDVIREVVRDLYCEKPDLEVAIMPCGVHDKLEEADEYINTHKNDVITDIFKLETGLWNLIGPFRQVRESTKYYNENTVVAEEIFKQIESDAKMGKSLMEQTIKKSKRENETRYGPKDPKFTAWCKQNTTLSRMGAVSGEDLKDECPDDAVESDVFIVGEGGKKLIKKKLYFKADEKVSATAIPPTSQREPQ